MNCKSVNSLLSEFVDERLPAAEAWSVQTHLSECAACGQVCRDLEALRRTLQILPVRQPSANFDTALAQRLALTRRPVPRPSWLDRLSLPFHRSVPRLRPAFALGVALAAVGGVLLWPAHAPVPDLAAGPSVHSADHAFVADCVAQRRRDAAGEPLADLAAQNLAGHLDNAASGEQSPTLTAESEVF